MIKQKNRSSRHKLIIALATMFIFIAALITAVVLIIAFPRQGLNASVKISYTAVGINGEVSATWQVGETIENMKTSTGETSIIFNSSKETETGSLSPLDEQNKNKIIQLSSTNDFVEFVYTFKNYGSLAYTVIMDFTEYENKNIAVTYKYNNNEYGTDKYGLVVKGVSETSQTNENGKKYEETKYYIKLKVADLAQGASFSSGFDWLLENYEPVGDEELLDYNLSAINFIDISQAGDTVKTYKANYNGGDIGVSNIAANGNVSVQANNVQNILYIPNSFGSAKVKTVAAKGKTLPEKTKVVIAEGVETIEEDAFREENGIVDIVFPGSIEKISKHAVYNCANVQKVTIGNGVETLGNASFANNTSLKSVVLPNSVKTTEESVFYNCTSLQNVTLSNELTNIGAAMFGYCALTSINIPSSVLTIGKSAFTYCQGLKELTIPNTVTEINEGAFYQCKNVEKLNFDANVTLSSARNTFFNIGGNTTNLTVVIGDNVNIISSGMFYECVKIKNVIIGSGVTEIGTDAFYRCSGLTNLTMGSNVNSIKSAAFNSCYKLESVTFPSTLVSIGENAFQYCDSLTKVEIPEGVESVGDFAFNSCANLTNISISKTVTNLGNSVFFSCPKLETIVVQEGNSLYHSQGNCLIYTSSKTLIQGCKNSTIPTDGSVTTVGNYAFYKCSGLTQIIIPSTVGYIGNHAFDGCSSLTEIAIPDTVTTLGEYVFYYSGLQKITIGTGIRNIPAGAFNGCSSLDSVTMLNNIINIGDRAFFNCSKLKEFEIPNSVTTIGSYAFNGCKGLTEITISANVTTIGEYAFANCSNLKTINYNAVQLNTSSVFSSSKNLFKSLGVNLSNLTINIGNNITTIPAYFCYNLTGIKNITIPNSITTINQYAFAGCTGLTEITIPENVKSIGSSAFENCSNVKIVNYNAKNLTSTFTTSYNLFSGLGADLSNLTINIGNNITTIPAYFCYNLTDIKNITIPNSVTKIDNHAFYGCTGLTEITISENITELGIQAFANCSNVKNINYNANLKYNVNNNVFTNTGATNLVLNIGSNVKTITQNLFQNNTGLITVNMEEGVETIQDIAFANCGNLKTVVLPNSLKTIGTSAFYQCANLSDLTFGNGLTSIGEASFGFCSALTELSIPGSVTTISKNAFTYCSGLTEITIPSSVTTIGEGAFYNTKNVDQLNYNANITASLNANTFTNLGYSSTNMKVIVGENVTQFPSELFANSFIKHIYIPGSVTSISTTTFGGTGSLECYYGGSSNITNLPAYTTINKSKADFDADLANPAAKYNSRVFMDLKNAFGIISAGQKLVVLKNNTMPITDLTKNMYLSCETDIELTMTAPLKLQGFDLTLGETDGGTLTLKASNSIEKVLHANIGSDLYIYNAIIDGNGTSQCITASGNIYIYGGGIQNGLHNVNGGGILTDGNITMEGGFIRNCAVVSNKSAKIVGGAVSISQGTFTMTGGEIYNNHISGVSNSLGVTGVYDGSYGGAIYVCDGATFEMYDSAKLTNNYITTDGFGGHVCISADSFMLMYGGTIEGDSTKAALLGGGITNLGELLMGAGTIKNVSATIGGGIASASDFVMLGGTITGCKSVNSSGQQTAYGNAIANLGNMTLVGGNISGDITNGYSPGFNYIIIQVPEMKGTINVTSLGESVGGLSEEEALVAYKESFGVDWCGFTGGYELTLCNVDSTSYTVVNETYFTNNVANTTEPIVSYYGKTASVSDFNLTNSSLSLAVGSGSGYDPNCLYLKK